MGLFIVPLSSHSSVVSQHHLLHPGACTGHPGDKKGLFELFLGGWWTLHDALAPAQSHQGEGTGQAWRCLGDEEQQVENNEGSRLVLGYRTREQVQEGRAAPSCLGGLHKAGTAVPSCCRWGHSHWAGWTHQTAPAPSGAGRVARLGKRSWRHPFPLLSSPEERVTRGSCSQTFISTVAGKNATA